MNRRQKIIVSVTGIFLVLLILVGLTYAYFLTRIIGNTNNKSISVQTANLALKYDDGNGELASDIKLIPNSVVSEKTFSVENNGDTIIDEYAVTLEDLKIYYANTINEETAGTPSYLEYPESMQLSIICNEYKTTEYSTNPNTATSFGTCSGYEGMMPTTNDILLTNEIEVGVTQVYSLTLKYLEVGYDQSLDMNKTLEAKIDIMILEDTLDLSGNFNNAQPGDYLQINNESINSTPKIVYANKQGKYKIVGLEVGEHTFTLYNTNTETQKNAGTLTVMKGDTAGINGTEITISGIYRNLPAHFYANTPRLKLGTAVETTNGTATGLVKVGDRIGISYIANTYTTPSVTSGKSVYPDTQTFNSAKDGGYYVNSNNWTVLSVDNGEVKLIPSDIGGFTTKLKMGGANAYLNAITVLNEMCSTLYSSTHGKARSINMEDINEIVEYDGTTYYRNNDGFVTVDKGTTVGDIENLIGVKLQGDRLVPGGGYIEDLELNYYSYRLLYSEGDAPLQRNIINNHLGNITDKTSESVKNPYYYLLLHRPHDDNSESNYWIANTMNDAYFNDKDEDGAYIIKYRMNLMNGKTFSITGKTMYNSNGVEEEDEYKVMPIIILNQDLKVKVNEIRNAPYGDYTLWGIVK